MMSVLLPLLWPLTGLYWIGLRLDQWWRGRHAKSLSKPVISIGNLTVGGTGKTPLLIHLCQHLLSRSKTPAVLTRGYRGFNRDSSSFRDNDESLLLKRRCPGVIVGMGADRWNAAQPIAARGGVDVFVLDDGFQHAQLKRQLDLVCIDATDPWGGGFLLPAGRLREPKRALRRAGAVIVNRAELVPSESLSALIREIESCAVGIPVFVTQSAYQLMECATGQTRPLETLNGRAVAALSAIGNPAAFETTLLRWAARVVSVRFSDHHEYTVDDVNRVISQSRAASADLVMTEKDWVKIESLPVEKTGMYVLQLNLSFSAEQQARLDMLIGSALA